MEVTIEQTRALLDELLSPLMKIIDEVLLNPQAVEIAEESLRRMKKQLSKAHAVAGILIDLDEVDMRKTTVEAYEAAVELLKARDDQQKRTVELYRKRGQREQGLREAQQALGF